MHNCEDNDRMAILMWNVERKLAVLTFPLLELVLEAPALHARCDNLRHASDAHMHRHTYTLGHDRWCAAHQPDPAGAGQSRTSPAEQPGTGLSPASPPCTPCLPYASSHQAQWLAYLPVLDAALLGWPVHTATQVKMQEEENVQELDVQTEDVQEDEDIRLRCCVSGSLKQLC